MTIEPELRLPSPLTEIFDERLAGVRLLLKRDDLIHPDFPGTKWRKLKYNIAAAGGRPLLTFGGAYSTHLLATAAAGHRLGFRTIGVVRGEERPSPVLAWAAEHGMTLKYISRSEYRTKADPGFADRLHAEFGDFHLIPEGGANAYGLRGCAELVTEIDVPFDVFCCATGTGVTLAGVATALRPGQRAIGFSVLKGGAFLNDDVTRLQETFGRTTANWSIETGFHFGGYARRTPALDDFTDDFRARHGIVLNRVYEAKMMSGLFGMVMPAGSRLVALLA
jgi:1-aminocyclopropane-1-carboxylate deaminase